MWAADPSQTVFDCQRVRQQFLARRRTLSFRASAASREISPWPSVLPRRLRFRRPPGTQVFPVAIDRFNQGDFLFAAPTFDLFLSCDGGTNIRCVLKVDKTVYMVAAGEARDEFFSVLIKPTSEIIRHADVERARSVRQDVDEILAHIMAPRLPRKMCPTTATARFLDSSRRDSLEMTP